ncbi:hypothetical protein M406DRAFT_335903 [Cryphonectria parasitica EP155]|uniref:C2H2-type domain-containing protein n=1 Tax=Cryphonectria parasitica (strain ATCC 38755 / EP155) TaxID=660469 RepID=A0A9P4YBU9_CRYP1|nr:uncharacterized protein M406DRAFT_335903 [Cryphonectria parasitica EP155]KAF3770183.1 hypothetical protein M406DRAFT_335903 [Cryphonectria parasitica EP155]
MSSASGIFSFSQTGPSTGPSGSAWDNATVAGSQNFFADQGESEDFFPLGPFPTRNRMETVDDFQNIWMPAAPAVCQNQTQKAEPMRRICSKGSASSHKTTDSLPSRSPSGLQSTMSQCASQASNFDMTGNESTTYTDGLQGNGRSMDSQFLFQQSHSLTTTPEIILTGPAIQPMMTGSNLEISMSAVGGDEQVQLQDWAASLPGGEGENARDHPLYRTALPQADGLYHCPWEGQTGCCHRPEKLKCNYDKFVDSHLKPYRCKMESCKELPFSSTACLLRHEREAHGMHGHGTKPYPCTFSGCDRAQPGNGFPRKWNLHDHMQRVHNAAPPSPDEDGRKDAARSRKRKSDANANNTGRKSPKSRKTSPKMQPQVPVKVDMSAKLREEWSTIQTGLPSIVHELGQLDGPTVMMQLSRLKDSLNTLERIHMDYTAHIRSTDPARLQDLHFVQQSG